MKVHSSKQYIEGIIKNKPIRKRFSHTKSESLTVQGQETDLHDVVKRISRGEVIDAAKKVFYDEIEHFDNIDPTKDPDFDLSDYTRLIDYHEQRLEALQSEKLEQQQLQQQQQDDQESVPTEERSSSA